MPLFDELKRRKVFRATSLYAVTAWGACLGAAELFPTFGLPDESVRWFVIGALGLLPVVALLAWLYELTPGGLARDPVDAQQLAPGNSSTRSAPQKDAPALIATYDGRATTFFRSFTIGRDEACELHIDDPKISRRHAQIVAERGTWYVEDLGSSNGTSLNGELVTRAALPSTAQIMLYDGGRAVSLHLASGGGSTTVLAGTRTQN